ncbi:MAG TPA: POT family MFS transporter [Anaeromyxobacteraceae bacterium]|jgi:POT family proton-dependent oligopeptide transporter
MARDRGDRFPPQIRYLAWNEGCERFSYYGMTSVLTIHMVQNLFLSGSEAVTRYQAFVGAAYLTPLLGAFLADRFFGRYRVVLWLSWGYVFGHATLALFESRWGLYAGLALIAVGAGGVKPCASAFVGDQFRPEQGHLLKRVYDLYYWMINMGSLAGQALIPWILDRRGPRFAFAVPGIAMGLALVLWWTGRRHYLYAPPTGPNPHGFFRVVSRAASRLGTTRAGEHWLDGALDRHPREAVDGARAVFRIVTIFAPVVAFWSLFFQYGSSWVLQAEKMDRELGGWTVLSSQVATLNALLILTFIPLFGGVLYPALERRGLKVTALGKMTAGMFVSVLSFACAAGIQYALDAGRHPSIGWQVFQYVFISAGEVLVSVTALEFAYTQAPPSMKSTIMGLWFVTIGVGSLLTAWVASLNTFAGGGYFVFFTVLMLAGAVLFRFLASRYRPVAFAAAPARAEAAS